MMQQYKYINISSTYAIRKDFAQTCKYKGFPCSLKDNFCCVNCGGC